MSESKENVVIIKQEPQEIIYSVTELDEELLEEDAFNDDSIMTIKQEINAESTSPTSKQRRSSKRLTKVQTDSSFDDEFEEQYPGIKHEPEISIDESQSPIKLRRSNRATRNSCKVLAKIEKDIEDEGESSAGSHKYFQDPEKISYALIETEDGICTIQLTDTSDEPHSWIKCCLCGFDYDTLTELGAHVTYHYVNFYSCFQCKYRRCLYTIDEHIRTCHPNYPDKHFLAEVVFLKRKQVNRSKAKRKQKWMPYEAQVKFLRTFVGESENDLDDFSKFNRDSTADDSSDEDERPLVTILKANIKEEPSDVQESLEPFQPEDTESLMFCSKSIYFLLLSLVQEEKHFSCQVCSLFFPKSQDLKLHMVEKHKCIRFKRNSCFSEEEFMFIGNYPEVHPSGTHLKNDYETGFEISFHSKLLKSKRWILSSSEKRTSLKCEKCSDKFPNLDELLRHVKEDHKLNGFGCRTCNIEEPLEYLKSHAFTKHGENTQILNFECTSIIPEPSADIFYIFYVNRLTVLRGNRQNTTCKTCSFFFSDLQTFDHHMKFKHSVFTYVCHTCKQSVDDIMTLDDHIGHNTSFFECVLTNLAVADTWYSDLNVHYVAGKIGDILKNSAFFNPKDADDFGVAVKLKVSDAPSYLCHICGKDFKVQRQHLKSHLKSHGITFFEKFQCVICNQTVSFDNFVHHCAAHKRKSILAFVHKVPSTKSLLSKYSLIGSKDFVTMSPQDAEINRFICSLCPSFYGRTVEEFSKHVQGMHKAPELLQCNKCQVSLVLGKLGEHAIVNHLGEDSYYEATRQAVKSVTTEPSIKKRKYEFKKTVKKSYTHVFSVEAENSQVLNMKSGRKDEFYCQKCLKEFQSCEEFSCHISTMHTATSYIICDKCFNVLTSMDQCGDHMRTYHNQNVHTIKFKVVSLDTNTKVEPDAGESMVAKTV